MRHLFRHGVITNTAPRLPRSGLIATPLHMSGRRMPTSRRRCAISGTLMCPRMTARTVVQFRGPHTFSRQEPRHRLLGAAFRKAPPNITREASSETHRQRQT